jgi:site-specific recombinase XerD
MEQSHHQPKNAFPLDRLVVTALGHLEKLGYSRRSLRRYRTIWNQLIAFSREHDLGEHYSSKLAERFVEAVRPPDGLPLDRCVGWRRHAIYGIRVLDEFVRNGQIKRCRTDRQKLRIPPAMKKPLRDYERHAHERLHLYSATLDNRIFAVTLFLDFLGAREVKSFGQIQRADIAAYVASLGHYKRRTVSRALSDVRQFLQYLLMRGILQHDLSQALPIVRVPRDATIPSVWDPEIVTQLLDVVDRSSPRGKRDYAILLLACRLGLRVGDIRTLTLDDLHWDDAIIEIRQAKTGTPLQLPLTDEVGEALIDYLQSSRPQTRHREVFLTARPPFAPFRYSSHLHHIVSYWRQLAGIRFRSKQRHGMHSLRHTLATQLLRNETPIHVISDILGHTHTASTLIYAKADVEALRGAALDPEESRHAS